MSPIVFLYMRQDWEDARNGRYKSIGVLGRRIWEQLLFLQGEHSYGMLCTIRCITAVLWHLSSEMHSHAGCQNLTAKICNHIKGS